MRDVGAIVTYRSGDKESNQWVAAFIVDGRVMEQTHPIAGEQAAVGTLITELCVKMRGFTVKAIRLGSESVIWKKEIKSLGNTVVVACDSRCDKAWGLSERPGRSAFGNVDARRGVEYLGDFELGKAPAAFGDKPETYEQFPTKWCINHCERSISSNPKEFDESNVPDFSVRRT